MWQQMVTEEDYKKEIRARFESEKTHTLQDILQPSPAKLKKRSIHLLDTLTPEDKKAYARFYDLENVTAKAIKDFDNDKFRPFTNFLNGKTSISDSIALELLAILVQFENRPFSKFRQAGKTPLNTPETFKEETLTEKTVAEKPVTYGTAPVVTFNEPPAGYGTHKNEAITSENETHNTTNTENNDSIVTENTEQANSSTIESAVIPQHYFIVQNKGAARNRIIIAVIAGILLLLAGYIITSAFWEENGCMTWKEDHYETVPCNMEVNNFSGQKIIPADKMLLKYQRKIAISDTTTFFNPDGQPRIFYAKISDNKCEYFTYPGKHPETGKDLKKISHYIINRYVRNNK